MPLQGLYAVQLQQLVSWIRKVLSQEEVVTHLKMMRLSSSVKH